MMNREELFELFEIQKKAKEEKGQLRSTIIKQADTISRLRIRLAIYEGVKDDR